MKEARIVKGQLALGMAECQRAGWGLDLLNAEAAADDTSL
jgi:hypothetical protein